VVFFVGGGGGGGHESPASRSDTLSIVECSI